MPNEPEKLPDPNLLLGDPFAIISGADFYAKTLPIAVTCDCGQPFQFDGLNGNIKLCPKCSTRFTHILLICPEDDAEAARDLLEHLLSTAHAEEIEADPNDPEKPPQAITAPKSPT